MLETALAGIRVIDFGQIAAGPVCAALLGDMGADVIKVESPAGDLGRKLGPPWLNGEGMIYMGANRNKRGIVLDLKSPQGVAAAKRLIETADVLVESFRPGVMARLGLGWETLKEINPRLVYCAVSAYGQTGPWKDRPGVDGIIQAMSGLMSVTGEAGGAPAKVQSPVVDMATAFLATSAVLAALHQRRTSGQGQLLDISMYESAVELQRFAIDSYLHTGELPQRAGSAAPYAAPNETFPTKDGWIMVAAYQEDRWRRLCGLLGIAHRAEEPAFATSNARVQNRPALQEMLGACFRTRTTGEWMPLLDGADILCAPVATYDEVVTSPQLTARGRITEVAHPKAGCFRALGFGLGRSEGVAPLRHPAPTQGQHTDEIVGQSD